MNRFATAFTAFLLILILVISCSSDGSSGGSTGVIIEEVPLEYYRDSDSVSAYYPFVQGSIYSYVVVINDSYQRSGTFTMPYIPDANFPDSWDGQSDFQLEWSLQRNARTQSLYVVGPGAARDDPIATIYMLPSDRRYSIPAGFMDYDDPSTEFIHFNLQEKNWSEEDGFYVVAETSVMKNYGYIDYRLNPLDLARRTIEQLSRMIENDK